MYFTINTINNLISPLRSRLSHVKKIKQYFYPIREEAPIKISYSQCGEDLIVKFIFDNLGISKPSYIDIGAHDPENLNNTAVFYLNGSKGINIEPDPMLFQKFENKRKRDVNLNIGIANIVGEMDFYFMSEPSLNTFSKNEATKCAEFNISVSSVGKIKVDTISNTIQTYWDNKFPDFLSLDVEGMDEIILKSINYEEHFPIVICVETISFSMNGNGIKNKSIIEFLESKGYLVYADTNINTIFVRKDKWIRQ